MTLRHEHLLGREFDMEKRNCYSLLRDFYRDNFGVELSDYANPTRWWTYQMDLYNRFAHAEGFELVLGTPREWRPGDVIVMAIQSSVGNHLGILLDGNRILHHLVGQRSCVTNYGGMFRNNTVSTYRHKDVAAHRVQTRTSVMEFLPDHVRRKLENKIPGAQAQAAAEARS